MRQQRGLPRLARGGRSRLRGQRGVAARGIRDARAGVGGPGSGSHVVGPGTLDGASTTTDRRDPPALPDRIRRLGRGQYRPREHRLGRRRGLGVSARESRRTRIGARTPHRRLTATAPTPERLRARQVSRPARSAPDCSTSGTNGPPGFGLCRNAPGDPGWGTGPPAHAGNEVPMVLAGSGE